MALNIADLLTNELIDARILATFLTKYFKDEWIPVLTSSLIDYLESNYNVVLPQRVRDKIGALQTLFMNDLFWEEWHVFEKCALALAHKFVRFDVAQEMEPEELTYAIKVSRDLRKESFSDEVRAYITLVYIDQGCLYPDEFIVNKIFFKDILNKLKVADIVDSLGVARKKIKQDNFNMVKDPLLREQLRRYLAVQAFLKDMERTYRQQKLEYKL